MSECACSVCVSACHNEPGAFLPEEVKGISPELLQLRLRMVGKHRMFLVTPKTTNGQTKGTCIFLENNRCSIYDSRPYECREMLHSDTQKETNRRLNRIAIKWQKI